MMVTNTYSVSEDARRWAQERGMPIHSVLHYDPLDQAYRFLFAHHAPDRARQWYECEFTGYELHNEYSALITRIRTTIQVTRP